MQGDQAEALSGQAQVLRGPGLPGPALQPPQGVDHDVAHQADLVRVYPLPDQIGLSAGLGDQEQVRDVVGDHPVGLLGHGPVERAQPGLHVDQEGPGSVRVDRLGGHQGAGQGGVHVPHHHHGPGPLGQEDRLKGGHDPGGLAGVAARAHSQGVVGPGNLQLVEEDVGEVLVVMLAGVDQAGPDLQLAAGVQQGRHLHEIGPGPGNDHQLGPARLVLISGHSCPLYLQRSRRAVSKVLLRILSRIRRA